MCNTAPIDISDQEPEGIETEVCCNTAEQLSGPTHAGDPMTQMSGYSVSAVGTTLEGSQGLPATMSGSQTSEVTQEQVEPEVTVSQQPQTVQDQEEPEIDVVGIHEVENRTPEAETSEMKFGNEDTP